MLIKESSIADSIILYLQIYVWFCKQELENIESVSNREVYKI